MLFKFYFLNRIFIYETIIGNMSLWSYVQDYSIATGSSFIMRQNSENLSGVQENDVVQDDDLYHTEASSR